MIPEGRERSMFWISLCVVPTSLFPKNGREGKGNRSKVTGDVRKGRRVGKGEGKREGK